MLKIGSFCIIGVVSLMFSLTTMADEITASVDQEQVSVTESVRLIIQIENSESEIGEPEFTAPDFDVGNQFKSFSSQSVYENGKFTFRRTTSTTYTLFPKRVGKFKIGNIRAKVGGKYINAQPLDVEVIDDSSSSGGNYKPFKLPDPVKNSNKSFFLHMSPNKSKVYEGEQVIASYYLYHKSQLADPFLQKVPTFENFWREELELTKALKPVQVLQNGQRYFKSFLVKYALFPLKPGKLPVDTMELTFKYRAQSPLDDDLFGSLFQASRLQPGIARSDVDEIEVIPLPEENRPDNFIKGAVGDFQIEVSPSGSYQTEVDKPFAIKYRFHGRGNALSFPDYRPNLPEGFEIFDPKVTKQVGENKSWKEVELLVFPRNPGTFELSLGSFSYFDPDKKQYIPLPEQKLNLVVTGEKSASSNESVSESKKPLTPREPGAIGIKDPWIGWGKIWGALGSIVWILIVSKLVLGKFRDINERRRNYTHYKLNKRLTNWKKQKFKSDDGIVILEDILKELYPDALTTEERVNLDPHKDQLRHIINMWSAGRYGNIVQDDQVKTNQEALQIMQELISKIKSQ